MTFSSTELSDHVVILILPQSHLAGDEVDIVDHVSTPPAVLSFLLVNTIGSDTVPIA
jgi:hypothetical protein